ncbi:MAG: precorrin-2 C(20)-methyltransferase [Hyphomicrobiaceae bacterium]
MADTRQAINNQERPGTKADGTLYCVGLGPGDPDLMTVKSRRLLSTAKFVAYFHKRGKRGNARTIADGLYSNEAHELAMEYPMTTEAPVESRQYQTALKSFYDDKSQELAKHLKRGEDIVVLCEGDPFFYGSFMHLYLRLRDTHNIEVVPGVTGMSGGWTNSGHPITYGDDVMSVLPGSLPEDALGRGLGQCDAAVIMKIGRNMAKVRRALTAAGLLERAIYVERGTMTDEVILPLAQKESDDAPYFSLILVPGQGRRL